MSNYPNMSYCMNENTLLALSQVIDAMREDGVSFLRELSRQERRAFNELFTSCEEFMTIAEELETELECEDESDEEEEYCDEC
jgi:hypothetical protein